MLFARRLTIMASQNKKPPASADPVPLEQYLKTTQALQWAESQLDMLSHTVNGGIARFAVDDGLRIIAASEGYYRMTGYTSEESLREPFCGKGLNVVFPQDLPVVNDALTRLAQNEPAKITFRIRRRDGAAAWILAYCARIDTAGSEPAIDVFMMDITSSRQTEIELNSLLDSIPAGVVRASVGPGILVHYANRAFYRQIGYPPEEFAGGIRNEFLRVVHPDDRETLLEQARAFADTDRECVASEFRIVTKRGQTRWMRATASRLSGPEQTERIIQGILTDITRERRQRQSIALNEERYRIISEQTRDTVFDWDLAKDRIQFSPVYQKMFGFMPPPDLSVRNLTDYDIIYEEDKPQVREMIGLILGGAPYAESEYRAKCADGAYLWCRNRVTTIFDDDGKPIRAIGLLTDINEYKHTACVLQEKAMRDSLTGLLNRMAFQRQVERILRESPRGRCAFLLLDVDRFKAINDTRGHAAGDAVLQKIAGLMTRIFRASDLHSRMGGDEFAVFLVNIPSAEAALQKARQFCREICGECGPGHITVSLGMAAYPEDGDAFEPLYMRADAALYEVKRRGGNGCQYGAAKP